MKPPLPALTVVLSKLILPAPLPDPSDPDTYRYGGSEVEGDELFRVPVTAGDVDGGCLDGSDPVFYVRRAPVDSSHPNRWVMFIPGGGSVSDADEAIELWKDQSDPTEQDAFPEMSSLWAAPTIGGRGIFNPYAADNPFADYNMVFIHKCTYDRFMGRNASEVQELDEAHTIVGYDPELPLGILLDLDIGDEVTLRFRGHDVVDAVIDTLGLETVSYEPDGHEEIVMPSLADAEMVLFIGHSGGAKGATQIIDKVAAKITTEYGADVRFVMDASYLPGAEVIVTGEIFPEDGFPTSDPGFGGDPLASFQANYDEAIDIWEADLDQTCLDEEAAVYACLESTHVLHHYIETPYFIRQDLFDPIHRSGDNGPIASDPDCWDVQWESPPETADCRGTSLARARALTDQIRLLGDVVLAVDGLETAPSGFFPACGHHGGAHTQDGFYSTLTTRRGVTGTYAQALDAWVEDVYLDTRYVEATPPVDINVSACP